MVIEMEQKELVKQIEAILFAAARAVSKEELKSFCSASDEEIDAAAILLQKKLDDSDSATMLITESNGWKLAVREKFTLPLRNIVPNTELNRSVLETLAVIAWKQPVMQAEVINIRTTKAYEHIAELEELGFIARQKHGRSFILKTSKKFNEYFDLPKQEAIKELFKDVKDESGNHNPQKKLDDSAKVEIYNVENPQGEESITGERLGKFDVYEASSEKEPIQNEGGEEFYEKADEEPTLKNSSEKKEDVYVELGSEDDNKEESQADGFESKEELDEPNENEVPEEKEPQATQENTELKKEKKVDTGRHIDYELEEMLEDKPFMKEPKKDEEEESEDE